ncbi:ribbon-helix-helix protein, CopG family [Prochlorococcus sp. MIT 1300]|uniref:ribbon-helix-helix protein, CopG family n=1 Tax=Prochlorococcus sp. MIT 1300 TaxID=3096218 RepID=UPI002A762131|nr:ribbon-helix-helix protein, CopG family [Prochlorococcus sp. MIT 1300]
MAGAEEEVTRRISVDLPSHLVERFDELKREWGLRGRGAVLRRLLEEILPNETIDEITNESKEQGELVFNTVTEEVTDPKYDENQALVLIGKKTNFGETLEEISTFQRPIESKARKGLGASSDGGIDLPGFVRRKTDNLKQSLSPRIVENTYKEDSVVPIVREKDVLNSLVIAKSHWINIYGQAPGDRVVEAAMIWLARDIWDQLDETQGRAFTWSIANQLMNKYFTEWGSRPPVFENIIVLAGILEDPFASDSLAKRIPTLIKRFVNRFKRSKTVTSFQTLESTMTVHGALKLLDLPTTAGASLTLCLIRDSYKAKALKSHPDAGGSTEEMRRLNEAYQLLKDLYRK